MKGIRTLIKISRQELDTKRRALAVLQTQKQRHLERLAALKKELAREKEMAGALSPEVCRFDTYLKRVNETQIEIGKALQELEGEIGKKTEEIADAYAEVKKFEVLLKQREKARAAQEKRRETLLLDEVAIAGHRRKEAQE